jgi:F0F1-type ATP synthase membrane subunit b/b'
MAGGGSGHDRSEINWFQWDMHAPPVGWFALDFALFVALLILSLRRPLRTFFAQRHDTIRAQIEAAQSEYNDARAHRVEYQDKLARVAQEVAALQDGANKLGASERDHIIAAAGDYARQLERDTETALAFEQRAAHGRLTSELVTSVLAAAQQRMVHELDAPAHQRLIEASITALEQQRPARPRRGEAAEAST